MSGVEIVIAVVGGIVGAAVVCWGVVHGAQVVARRHGPRRPGADSGRR